MKENERFWQETISEIENELDNIAELRKELKKTQKKRTETENRRLQGSILHDFYNCCERIFRKIATDINGGFGRSETWHKELLYRMTIAVKNVRPAVISKDMAGELDDYLSFRHVFRNIYGFELKGERINRLVVKFNRVSKDFEKQIVAFLKEMEKK